MVYLDYNATTPLAEEVLEAMMPYLAEHYGNPSSIHSAGRNARAAVDNARDSLAGLLGVRSHEIIFTGGGTEANNLAILGLARAHRAKGAHLITCATEHHAVLHAFEHLRDREGFEVTILPVNQFGQVDLEQLQDSLRPDTLLLSLMSANNETGTLHPILAIAEICRERGVLFHSDMVQSFGKQSPLDTAKVDSISLAAHKFYGPKGVGALYLRSGIPLETLHFGGFHENQRRPGTENVAGIVGLASAASLVAARMAKEAPRLKELRDELWKNLSGIEGVRNGHPTETLPNTLNVSFPGVKGETLLIALDLEGLCVSSGSACMVGSVLPSHVLFAMEVPSENAQATVRFSLGHFTNEKEIQFAAEAVGRVLRQLKAFA